MMRFIKKPNLPNGKLSRVICGEIPGVVEDFFILRKIEILKCEPNLKIDPAVKFHADMCAAHLGGNSIIVDRNQIELIQKLKEYRFNVYETKEEIAGEYPEDIKLNVALFGNNAVGAFRFSDKNLFEAICGFEKFEVKQGYAKCSILPINETALITDDISIYNSLKNSFDVLLVEKGDIRLGGHEYGFIGGASAKISNNEILFFGNLENHRNFKDIIRFIEKHSCKALYFKDVPLTDVGGMVTLCEYI